MLFYALYADAAMPCYYYVYAICLATGDDDAAVMHSAFRHITIFVTAAVLPHMLR